jgi:hypothetical protein
MNDNLRSLKEAIHIRNEFNRIAAPILEHYKEASKPFIGKKIDTQKGLASKFADALKFDRDAIEVKPIAGAKYAKIHHVSAGASYNDLTVRISLCFGDHRGTGCIYEERGFWFGKIENQILISVNDDCKISDTVLDFNEELEKIKAFRALEKLAEEAEEKILINREAYKYLKDF